MKTLAILALAIAAATPARADDILARQEEAQIELFTKVAPAVIFIGDERSLGTGFFVTDNGLALTAAHVVGDQQQVNVVLYGGKRARAKLVAKRDDFDLALLQVTVDHAVQALALAASDDLRVGQWVGAVGHGLGGVWAFTTGMVSNLYEADHGSKIVQTQIPLNPGNSGGPIFDRTGRVVAIVSKGATTGNALNLGVHAADAFLVFDVLLPECGCLAVDVAGQIPVFLDDVVIGKGPRVIARPHAGAHAVSAVVGGHRIERTVHFPADRHVVLGQH